jgi:Ca2+-transporting ATPase
MLKRQVLVRKLNSIETLGSTDVICADKTGTLTKGEMTVRELYAAEKRYEVSGAGYETEGEITIDGKQSTLNRDVQELLKIGLACNNAVLESKGRVLGDPTEAALMVSAQKGSIVFKAKRIDEIPFSAQRKMMSVLVEEQGKLTLYSKGAPEIILTHCRQILRDGKVVQMSESHRRAILDQTESMSQSALRTLAFAYRSVESRPKNHHGLEDDLVFVGLQGMIDPPRDEVKDLVAKCHESGIRIIMITGDHAATAAAVAREIGIAGPVVTGTELATMKDADVV